MRKLTDQVKRRPVPKKDRAWFERKVDDEMRNLTQRCATAAQETASLIEKSIAKSKDGRAGAWATPAGRV
jgi:hypothetical protein